MQPSSFPLQVTVLRAHDLPRIKTSSRKECRFYVTVIAGARTWHTRALLSTGNRVEWNEDVDAFTVLPHSRLTISLYAKTVMQRDIRVGTREIDCEPQRELDISFGSAMTKPATPYITITMSANPSSSVTASDNALNPRMGDLHNLVAEEGATHSTDTTRPTAITTTLPSSSRMGTVAIQSGTPVASIVDSQTEMSHTLDRAGEALDTVKTWKTTANTIKWVMDTVSPILKLNPYASLAWTLFSKIPESLLHQFQLDDNVRTLLIAIWDAFEFAKDADVLSSIQQGSTQAKILEEMLQCVSESAEFIESYSKDVQVGKRVLKNIGGQLDDKVETYRTTFVRLHKRFLTYANVIAGAAVIQIRDDMRDQLPKMSKQALETELRAIIGETPVIGGWRSNDRKGCHPGTREDFLRHIIEWVGNPNSERGLVLFGQAGTGKSSIAHEVAHLFDKKCLGSYVAFRRKEESKDAKGDGYHLFTTLARDLCDRYPPFKLALGEAIIGNSSFRNTQDYCILSQWLLLEPLKYLQLDGTILLVIDALDESGTTIGKNGLHTFLAQHLIKLPPNFRILITSRPEHGIETAFANAKSVRTLYMNDAQLAADTEHDIRIYLQNELPDEVFKEHGDRLAKGAEGLFQWAAVASGFINSPDNRGVSVKKVIQRLLGHSRGRGIALLDHLYEEVLKEYFKSEEAQALFRSIMGQLLAAIEPLSIRSLISFRQHAPIDDPDDLDPIPVLRHLGSLLSNVTSSNQTHPIVPLHTSFRDFLINKTSNVFYVDLADAHRQLAYSCLGLMLNSLKFNICKLESSYLANSDVPDLESRIAEHIPSGLSYSCIYWVDHLGHLAFNQEIFKKVRSLFETKFLFWLEVLSIKSRVGPISPVLSWWLRLERTQPEVQDLLGLVHDASAFVRYFGIAVEKSAPHIYVSALPFTPTSSRIRNQYLSQFPYTLTLGRGQLSHWPALEMTIYAHDGPVRFVTFSPDGHRIASWGSTDGTICVWDARTGEIVAGPFPGYQCLVGSVAFWPDGQRIASASARGNTIHVRDVATGQIVTVLFFGHTAEVVSVSFSPDGRHVASASLDRMIRMWNTITGEVVAGPFTGHTDKVRTVAFSPDGQHVASASDDGTICVWDAATAQIIAGPFTGHTHWVRSVAFSPDGHRIASASYDRTIRVWDITTGVAVAGPFIGHTDSVKSVAFSPDGQHIASASYDGTIRLWDATIGVAGPFTGHTDATLSVSFSPDGQRIASASENGTIRVWDIAARQIIAHSFTGHSDRVRSIAFSPDGQRIASASDDHVIYMWDAATGQIVAHPFTGHTDRIMSVAFSPDGQRVASCSHDRTIRVWDATTGKVVAGPFTGHTFWVMSVAFSPDGRHIASASYDHTIQIWVATTGRVVAGPFTGHTDGVMCVTFSPDGKCIASASRDHTVCIWDATTGQLIVDPFTGHTYSVNSVAFSPDGQRLVSASGDATICVWDITTGRIIAGPFTGHTSSVHSAVFSPDGKRVASASNDCTIRIWDAATGEIVAGPFTGHTDKVNSIAFSLDGQCIASASYDRTIRMWDITGQFGGDRYTGHTSGARSAEVVTNLTDQSLIDADGWICGEEKELFLWIPELHRQCLHRPSTVWIAGEHETRLDFSKFAYGSNWATVYRYNS